MKRFILLSLTAILAMGHAFAQADERDLPTNTLIPHYRLTISYNTTTVLVFSTPVRPIDRGDRDILAIKQPGVDNVLKIKAARVNFPPTNLHVFTADGRIYAFDITYSDSLASSRDLTRLVPTADSTCTVPVAILTGQAMNEEQLSRTVALIRNAPGHHLIEKVCRERMTLAVEQIGQSGPLLFFRIRLQNRSNLPYVLNFLRCYVRDSQKAKRTSIQDQEMLPIYQDSIAAVGGHSQGRLVIALPMFTLANRKEFVLEAYEQHGGRSLVLRLHNHALLRARPL